MSDNGLFLLAINNIADITNFKLGVGVVQDVTLLVDGLESQSLCKTEQTAQQEKLYIK